MFSAQFLSGLVQGAMALLALSVVTLVVLWIRDYRGGSLW